MQWWSDWRMFKTLPWPGSDIKEQPAFVYDAIVLCERAYDEAVKELQDRA